MFCLLTDYTDRKKEIKSDCFQMGEDEIVMKLTLLARIYMNKLRRPLTHIAVLSPSADLLGSLHDK